MGEVFKANGAVVIVIASALLWANFAWAAPWTKIDGAPEAAAGEELTDFERHPAIYNEIVRDEGAPGIFDLAAAGETWTCPNCGSENPAGTKYCPECGTKKGEGVGAAGLSNVRVCPKCGFVNEKEAKFCGDCGYNFSAYEAGTAAPETVYVPGRGYVPKGTMIDPGHRRAWVWATGLGLWLLVGPAIASAGIGEESLGLYVAGGTVSLAGLVMFIVGLAVKTDPVYALRTGPGDDVQTRLAYARKSLEPEGPGLKVEVPLVSF
jgi:RNA polymerase subunit RPABC4/transcription elongation factor Spt4